MYLKGTATLNSSDSLMQALIKPFKFEVTDFCVVENDLKLWRAAIFKLCDTTPPF